MRIQRLEGPPALVVGGYENSVSVVRSLARRGVKVRVIAHRRLPIRYSRYPEKILLSDRDFWAEAADYLLGAASDHLAGSVLFAHQDDHALSILVDHWSELSAKFRIMGCNPDAQRAMLDKSRTNEAAIAAAVPTPRCWPVDANFLGIAEDVVYPLLIKPKHGHLSRLAFGGKKYLLARGREEAEAALRIAIEHGVDVLLMEMIPGPDDLLCSYYTYFDDAGTPLFDFTKRVIRRRTKNMGIATYHVTDHVEAIKELSLRLCSHVGLRGLACVEFKNDPRDGQYKLIECNARFTAATSLVAASGIDLAELVYRQVVGLPQRGNLMFRDGVRLWDPVGDLAAYRDLRDRGEMTAMQWLRSLMHRQNLPLWSWRDPVPAVLNVGPMMRALTPRLMGSAYRRVIPRSPSAFGSG